MEWFTSQALPHQLFRNFVMGGTIVATVSYMATFMNPVLAAIWWSYPFTIIPSLYFMKQNKVSNANISKFLISSTFALSILVACMFFMSRQTKLNKPLLEVVGTTTLFWMLCGALFYFFHKIVE